MSGFDNEVVNAVNWDFRGVQPVIAQVTMEGQLPIGTGVASPAIEVGNITSTTLTIGYSNPDITIEAGTTVPTTFDADSGSATPAANILNILGRSGSKTAGAGNTLTVRSPPYQDQAGSTTITLNSGSFATNAITLTVPASAGLADGDLVEFVATNGVLVIQLAGTQIAHLGIAVTTAGGTLTGSATGDSMTLRYQESTDEWWATSSEGVWVLA